jgi:molybdopterin-binding protein
MTRLTVRAAAERLGVGYSTLKRWVLSGRVRTTQTAGGHHRIAESEIERLLARRAPASPAHPVRDADEQIADLSARNRLHGYIEEVRVDGLLAQIRLRVGDQSLTAVVTADAVQALELKRGDDALAIIKSTEVMIARPMQATSTSGRRPPSRRTPPQSRRRRRT